MASNLALTIGLTIVGVAFVVGFFTLCTTSVVVEGRKDRRKQEIAHEQRLKAIEFGRPFPDDGKLSRFTASPAVALGLGCAATTFPLALVADLTTHSGETPWMIAGAVSIVGMLCGTVISLFNNPKVAETSTSDGNLASDAKLRPVDPDLYDVVSSRS